MDLKWCKFPSSTIKFLSSTIVLVGDLNVLFDSKLEKRQVKPLLKQKSVAKPLELKEEYYLCDVWRIRNPTKKSYTFR